MAKNEEVKNGIIFPVGDKNEAYANVFTGQSFLKMLVNDPEVSVALGNVTLNQVVETTGMSTKMAIKFC